MEKFRFGCARPLPMHIDDHSVCVVAPNNPVIEGKELLDSVCPVNKFTGHRISAFKLLGKLTGAKADVLNAVLQEIPALASDPRLTDEDRCAAIVERCSTGTPAEDALMAQRIMADLDALGLRFPSVEESKPVIEFNSDDASVEQNS